MESLVPLLEKLWDRNISIHTGMVHTHSINTFMKSIVNGNVDANKLISGEYKLSEIEEAYHSFKHAGESGSLKLLIHNDQFLEDVMRESLSGSFKSYLFERYLAHFVVTLRSHN